MRLEWIEDILAVMETGSLARAANKRFLTQSAFTRRIRMIENSIGADLFDRSRKPIEVLPSVRALEPELRDTAARLGRLRGELRNASSGTSSTLAFACQHAITATVSPEIVAALATENSASIRVRSGNRDECLMMLLSGEVDFALMYEAPDALAPSLPYAFESATLDRELLIPVCTPDLRTTADGPVIPVISYPAEVFLGRFFSLAIAPQIPAGVSTVSKAETALTLAVFRYVLRGIGIGWLPQSLVQEALDRNEVCSLDEILPSAGLNLMMIWLPKPHRPHVQKIRQDLLDRLYPDTGSRQDLAQNRSCGG